MKVRVFQSGKGDALLLTSAAGKYMLVDGGVPDAYEEHWASSISRLCDGKDIDLVCISHIDRDHIGGVLEMLENEVAWRVYEYQSSLPAAMRGRRSPKKPKLKRPPRVKAIWHNAFFEKVYRERLTGGRHGLGVPNMADVLFRSAAIYAGAGETAIADSSNGDGIAASALANRLQFLGQSVGDAIEVSRRIGDKQLSIPLNPEYRGDFVIRRGSDHSIAGLKIRVLGPTRAELCRA